MENFTNTFHSFKIAVVMVGLPARGKTYIARKIVRYLDWLGYRTKIFNVGNYRREKVGAQQPSSFFDPANQETSQKRTEVALECLNDMIKWFENEERRALDPLSPSERRDSSSSSTERLSQVSKLSTESTKEYFRAGGDNFIAVYDATNSARERRQTINNRCREQGIQCLFIESICDLEDVITSNVREVKISSPDYEDADAESATKDFMQRIEHYASCYETILPEENLSFVKNINIGSQFVVSKVKGHGESSFNNTGQIGGNSDLSEKGQLFAKRLPEELNKRLPEGITLTVWVSTLKRTIQTSQHLPYSKMVWKQLDELNSGVCDGMTYEEIEAKYPEDFSERDRDKFLFRYKGGESYHDLVQRLEPIIMELERHHEPNHVIYIIGHQAVIRCIYGIFTLVFICTAYFMNHSRDQLPYLNIPLHTVILLTPKAYNCQEVRYKAYLVITRFAIDVPAADTYRAKPTK